MSQLRSENIVRFEEYVAHVMEQGEAAGLAVAVIDRDGQTLYEHFWGHRDRERGLPVDGDTVFGLASVTKSFTALAVLQLCEQGLLALHDPVCRHIPEFTRPGITVEHLLCHSAGFYPQPWKHIAPLLDELGRPEGDPAYDAAVFQEAARRHIAALNDAGAPIGPPGEYFSYSNDSYGLLSALVCRLSGCGTFARYVDQHILSPLGMSRSGCGFEWQDDNISRLYQHRNGVLCGNWSFYDAASALPGGGAMKSTLSDMKKYVGMYLNLGRSVNGVRLLSNAGIRRMARPRITCELNQTYGLGLMIKPLADLTVIEHGGDMPGIASHMAFSHETGVGVVVLCNTSKVTVSAISDLAMLLVSGRETVPYPPAPPTPVEWDSALMEQVCGEYRSGEGNTIRITPTEGGFAVDLDGAGTFAYPMNNYMLNVKAPVLDIQASIYRDDDGRVWALGGGYRVIPKVE